ncbi:hypothetical protein C884_00558 [Kocuria palustris PEL]|uniref:Uncharacterized protein n=1 Tax=Kocuria palustris PEL TaxID=1236550 RepID=M2WCS2_9MICC|nr:hypothetical protein C884_00558 [Kocuria palustris PEL]
MKAPHLAQKKDASAALDAGLRIVPPLTGMVLSQVSLSE